MPPAREVAVGGAFVSEQSLERCRALLSRFQNMNQRCFTRSVRCAHRLAARLARLGNCDTRPTVAMRAVCHTRAVHLQLREAGCRTRFERCRSTMQERINRLGSCEVQDPYLQEIASVRAQLAANTSSAVTAAPAPLPFAVKRAGSASILGVGVATAFALLTVLVTL